MTTIWKAARESTGPPCYRPPDLDLLWPSSSVFSTQCMAGNGAVLSCPVLSYLDLGCVILHFPVQCTATLSKHHESSVQSNGHLVKQETTARQAWTEQFLALASPVPCYDTKPPWRSQAHGTPGYTTPTPSALTLGSIFLVQPPCLSCLSEACISQSQREGKRSAHSKHWLLERLDVADSKAIKWTWGFILQPCSNEQRSPLSSKPL